MHDLKHLIVFLWMSQGMLGIMTYFIFYNPIIIYTAQIHSTLSADSLQIDQV